MVVAPAAFHATVNSKADDDDASSSPLKNLEVEAFLSVEGRTSGDVFACSRRFWLPEQPLGYAATSLGMRIRL
jgi:hypothetical protein